MCDEILVSVMGIAVVEHLAIEHPKLPAKVDFVDFPEYAFRDSVVRPSVSRELLAGPGECFVAQLGLFVEFIRPLLKGSEHGEAALGLLVDFAFLRGRARSRGM